MSRSPYTRDEIKAFVASALMVVGRPEGVNPDWIRERYVYALERLPPWHQILLIENRAASVVGDEKTIRRFHRHGQNKPGGVTPNGFFKRGQLSMEFRGVVLEGRNVVFWHTGARGEAGLHTRAHEDGHRIDAFLGEQRKSDGRTVFFSEQSEELKRALAEELRDRRRRRARGDLPPLPSDGQWLRGLRGWLLGKPAEETEIDGVRVDLRLYEGYRDIAHHLKLYRKNKAACETFAEMTGHYTELYGRYDGNMRVVDSLLSRHYPHYWPAYRDHVIPRMEEYATQLQERRLAAIEEYVAVSWSLARARDADFDEEESRRRAGIAAVRGTLAVETDEIRHWDDFYQAPAMHMLNAARAVDELIWYCRIPEEEWRDKPYVFNVAAAQRECRRVLRDEGVEGVRAYYNELQARKAELIALFNAEDRFFKRVGCEEGLIEGSPQTRVFLDRFERLVSDGGAAAVAAYRRILPSVDQVNDYIIARASWQETRSALRQDDASDAVVPEVMEKELRMVVEQGGHDGVAMAIEDMQEESRLLSAFYRRHNMNAETISRLADQPPRRYAGETILNMFDRLVDGGGLTAVEEAITRLTVPVDALADYCAAREDLESTSQGVARAADTFSWRQEDGLYRPFQGVADGLPAAFRKRLAADLQELVTQGGAESVAEETARIRRQVHDVIARAGPAAQAPGKT